MSTQGTGLQTKSHAQGSGGAPTPAVCTCFPHPILTFQGGAPRNSLATDVSLGLITKSFQLLPFALFPFPGPLYPTPPPHG